MRENAEKKEQNTWYQLILLESVAFVPYTALALEGKENLNQSFRKLRYRKQNDFLKKLVIEHAISSETMVDRYAKSYEKSLNTGLGRKQKMINRGLFVLASAAVVAAGVGVAAPSIAVALKGAGFAGLQGASLVSASLVALSGETIAIGGKGMVSGLATRVGGDRRCCCQCHSFTF